MFASYNSSGVEVQEPSVVNDPAEKLLRQAQLRHRLGLMVTVVIASCFLIIAILAVSIFILVKGISNGVHDELAAHEARLKQDDLEHQNKVKELERRKEALERKKAEYRARRPSDRELAEMYKEESDLRDLSWQTSSGELGGGIGKPIGEGLSDAMRAIFF